MDYLQTLWRYRSSLLVVLSPIVLLPLPLAVPGKEALCAYCMILMAIYWITEVIPLAITSFIPLVLFPMLGIMTANDVSRAYFNNTNWLFVGGLAIAVAVETTNLHKRISLRVLTLLGAKPRCLMFGFMITTFFLSMWISNTATTAMMLPIVEAVTKELVQDQQIKEEDENEIESTDAVIEIDETNVSPSNKPNLDQDEADFETSDDETNAATEGSVERVAETFEDVKKEKEKENSNLQKGLTLCVPYSASIGGAVTITGTGTNVVLHGQFSAIFANAAREVTFARWFFYTIPAALIFFLLAYFWLSSFYLGFSIRNTIASFRQTNKTAKELKADELLKREYQKLGSMSWAEVTVLVVFATTAFLWFFREPGFMPGWSDWFEAGYVDDGTVAIGMAFLLFFLPASKPMFLMRRDEDDDPAIPVAPVMTWRDMQTLFPWNVVLLLGGGFALAEGATASGFSRWLADELVVLDSLPSWIICLIITVILCVFTEFTSNVATASLFVPILARLAQAIRVHPLYLLIPPILATSMAFMLPVATPPNAIAFAYGHVQVIDMIKAGSVLNLLGILIVTFFINTYGVPYFGLNTFPVWALPNSTIISRGRSYGN